VIEDLKKNRRTFTQNLLKLDIPGPFIQYTPAGVYIRDYPAL
jgi:hypothetical protein